MCPPADWFDDIVAGDPLSPDPSPARRDPASSADPSGVGSGQRSFVTEGFDDLFVDFQESELHAESRAEDQGQLVPATRVDDEDDDLVLPLQPRREPDEASQLLGPLDHIAVGEEHLPDTLDNTATQSGFRRERAVTAPQEAAYAGEGWAGDEDVAPADAPWETDIDTSLVTPQEMTGVWLTTEADRESPLRMDGEPIEPEELDLPPDIADRLRDWSDQWRAEWNDAAGWLPRARIRDYEALGHWLARRVKDGAGAIDVTLQLAHLGRAGIERIQAAGSRRPIVVHLANRIGGGFPVQGDFVTDSGVGSFSAELNAKLEGWAAHFVEHMDPVTGWHDRRAARDHAAFAGELAGDMTQELGEDYRVELDLWELNGVLDAEGPRR